MSFEFSDYKNSKLQMQIKSWYTQWILIDHLYAEFAQYHGISSSTMFIMRMLYDTTDGCSQGSICEYLTLPKQTVSSTLKILEEKGYVTKITDDKDKRNKLVCLTYMGTEFIGIVISELHKIEEKAFNSLSEKDRVAYMMVNEALTKALHTQMKAIKKTGGSKL